jgi:vacuolar-type H+-ATPase subunit H
MQDQLSQQVAPPRAAGESTDLARLLETEARLEERLHRARDEATRLVAAAREAAVACEATLAAQVEADARRLGETLHAEYERAAAAAAATAGQEAERLDAVTDARVAALARHAVSRVIGTEP